jgi:hypothetical protein
MTRGSALASPGTVNAVMCALHQQDILTEGWSRQSGRILMTAGDLLDMAESTYWGGVVCGPLGQAVITNQYVQTQPVRCSW